MLLLAFSGRTRAGARLKTEERGLDIAHNRCDLGDDLVDEADRFATLAEGMIDSHRERHPGVYRRPWGYVRQLEAQDHVA